MDRRASIADELGVALGAKREPTAPALRAFQQRQVPIGPNVLARLRSGQTSGAKLDHRLRCADVFRSNDASRKDGFYLRLAETALEIRTFRSSRPRIRKYASHGYTDELARELDENRQALRRCLRAMRADMVSAAEVADQDWINIFRMAADAYLDACLALPPSLRSPLAVHLEAEWNHATVADFYRALYEESPPPRSIGAWTPYEMQAFHAFYRDRVSSSHQLTPFDRLVLSGKVAREGRPSVLAGVERLTGLRLDGSVIDNHRKTLVYGRPTSLNTEQ